MEGSGLFRIQDAGFRILETDQLTDASPLAFKPVVSPDILQVW